MAEDDRAAVIARVLQAKTGTTWRVIERHSLARRGGQRAGVALMIVAAGVAALALLFATLVTPAMPCVRLGNMPIAGACH